MYEEALVQYDELDALFAQFIVNHSLGGESTNAQLNPSNSACLVPIPAQFIVNHSVGGESTNAQLNPSNSACLVPIPAQFQSVSVLKNTVSYCTLDLIT